MTGNSNKGQKIGRKISLEKRQEIINWYLGGYSTIVIAKEYGIDHSTIFYYVRDVKHLRKKSKPNETPLGKTPPEELPQISKELKEEMKINPLIGKGGYIAKIRPKGLTYKDYLEAQKQREFKKLIEGKK